MKSYCKIACSCIGNQQNHAKWIKLSPYGIRFSYNLVFAGSRHIYVPLWVLMEGWKIHNAGWSSSLGRHAVRAQWQVAIRGRCICWVIKGLFIWSRSVPWARYLEIFCKILMFSYCRPGLLGFSKRSLGKLGEILAIWTLQPSHQD